MNKLTGFVSLLFVIGSGYLNDNIATESFLDVGHFYIASYSREKNAADLLPRWPLCSMLLLLFTVIV